MATITLTPATTYQTMGGWEATAQAGETDSPIFTSYANYLFGQAASDLGINRLRLEVFTTRTGTPTTFDFPGTFDPVVTKVVSPMRTKLIAQGESLWVNVCFVFHSATDINLATPSNYAAAVLATYQHMQSAFGFLPNSWEICLEPDNFGWPSATALGNCLVAAGTALVGAGFTPYFVVPSNVNPGNAISYWSSMTSAVPAVLSSGWVKEFSYHRYSSPTTPQLQSIEAIGTANSIKTGMLEHIAADYNELYADLTIANCSNWQQFTLAYPAAGDDGAQYYVINNAGGTPALQAPIASRTKYLRQYFKFVRRGAVRIDAATDAAGSFDPVAFINTGGDYVVVVKTTGSGSMTITGLVNGPYSIKYTTASIYDMDLASQSVAAGSLTTSIPGAGVLTIYGSTTRIPLTVTSSTAPGTLLPGTNPADAVNGNRFLNTGREFVEVTNGSGSSIDVTFVTVATYNVGSASYAIIDRVVSVAAGASKVCGPFETKLFNDSQGQVQVNWSADTSVTCRVITVGQA